MKARCLRKCLAQCMSLGSLKLYLKNGNGVIGCYEKNLTNYKVYSTIFSVAYSSSCSNKYNIFDSFEIKYKKNCYFERQNYI